MAEGKRAYGSGAANPDEPLHAAATSTAPTTASTPEPASTSRRRRTLLAFLIALILILAVIAALEFIPSSPFEGLLRGWVEKAQSSDAPSLEVPGNPTNDETSPAIGEWLATERPEVSTVTPPSFPPEAEGEGSDEATDPDGEGEDADIPDEPGTPDGSSASSPSQDGPSAPGSGSGTNSAPGSGSGTGANPGGSSSDGSGSNPNPGSGSTTTTPDGPSSSEPSESHVHALATREVFVGTHEVRELVEEGHWGIVHHDAVYDDWDEAKSICNDCGEDITGRTSQHMESTGQDRCNGFHIEYVYHHDLVTEAYDAEEWIEPVYGTARYAIYVDETYCTECGEVVERSGEYIWVVEDSRLRKSYL